jgi:hypothetical protein
MDSPTLVNILVIVVAIVATFGVFGLVLWFLLKQNYKQVASILAAVNQNIPLQNAIETVGQSTPKEVVNALLGVLNMLVPIAGNTNPDLVTAINELKELLIAVTDGLTNTGDKPPEGGAVG